MCAFLGEYPDQPAFTDLLEDREQQDGGTTDTNLPAPVLHAADHYTWEGSNYGCSLTNAVAVSLPNAHLLRLLAPDAYARDGAIHAPHGEVIAFAPNIFEPGEHALLICVDILHTALTQADLALGSVIYQERRSGEAHRHDPWPGWNTRTSLHIHQPTSTDWNLTGSLQHDHQHAPRPPHTLAPGTSSDA